MSQGSPVLAAGPNDLLCFADETGDTVVSSTQAPLFGFGAVLLPQPLYAAHEAAWRGAKLKLLGDPNAALHAAEIPRNDTQRYGPVIGSFFRGARFRPLMVTQSVDAPTDLVDAIYDSVIHAFFSLLLRELRRLGPEMGGRLPDQLVMIFEHNEKLAERVKKLGGAGLHASTATGTKRVTLLVSTMPKASGEVGLEWADFVAHAAYRRCLGRRQGRPRGADFNAIFPGDGRGGHCDIDRVDVPTQTCWDVWGGHHWAVSDVARIDLVATGDTRWLTLHATADRRPVSRHELKRVQHELPVGEPAPRA